MTDANDPTATVAATTSVTEDNAVTSYLASLGVQPELVQKIRTELGAETVADLSGLLETDLASIGMKPLPARRLLRQLCPVQPGAPAAEAPKVAAPAGTPNLSDQVGGFASALGGGNPMMMMALLSGGATDIGLSDILPIRMLIDGYNPKVKDLFYVFMDKIQQRFDGLPIVVINHDGSINRQLTVEYVEGLDEGQEPAEDDITYASDGVPYQLIRVGVDAQSVYDADPLVPTKVLQKSGMGTGRVNWHDVALDVRQVAFYAATQTKELDPTNDGHMAWLRDHIKPGVSRLILNGMAPRAITLYNEASRTGSLPTLRKSLGAGGARRPDFVSRRRRVNPRDLSGAGDPRNTFPGAEESPVNPKKW